MREKIVNVPVRMVPEGGRVVAKGIGTGIVLLESDWTPAMHAAAEELRAQGAELGEDCERCNGTGRSCGNGRCDYQWCASCKVCNGTGRKTEESDGKELCDLEEAIGFAREVLAAHEGGAP